MNYRENAMAPHSSTVAWKIPWMEEPGRLQSMGSLRVRHDWSDLAAAAVNYKTFQPCCCSVAQSCSTCCNHMDCSMLGFPVLHYLPKFAQTHVHWVGDAIQLSNPLFPPSPPVLNLSQHWGLLQWVSSLHQVAKVLEFQLQHQSFQWIFRLDFL